MISLSNWTLIIGQTGGVHISYGISEVTPLIVACRVEGNGIIATVYPAEQNVISEDGEYYLNFKELVLEPRPLINYFVAQHNYKMNYRTPEIVRALYDFIAILSIEAHEIGLSAIDIDNCFDFYRDALPYKNIDCKELLKVIRKAMLGE